MGSGASVGGRVRRPVDLPEGCHTSARGAELRELGLRDVEGCPSRRAVGRCQGDGDAARAPMCGQKRRASGRNVVIFPAPVSD